MKHMKNCKQCQNSFNIRNEDKAFYTKTGVPEPTFCPQCRVQRRLAWRNERKCSKCGDTIETIYSDQKQKKVYCEKCYLQEVQ